MKIVTLDKTEYISATEIGNDPLIFFGKEGKLCGTIIYSGGSYWLYTTTKKIQGGSCVALWGAIQYAYQLGYTCYMDVSI